MFIGYSKACDCLDHEKHLAVLRCNPCCGQEAAVRTECIEETGWFPIGEGVRPGCTLSQGSPTPGMGHGPGGNSPELRLLTPLPLVNGKTSP